MTSQRHRSTQKRAKFGKPISQTGSPWKHAVISNCCILLLCYHAFVNLNDCTCICPGHRGHCVSSDQSQPQHLTEALGNHRQQLISSLIHLRWGSHLLGIRWIPIMISVLHCWGPWKKREWDWWLYKQGPNWAPSRQVTQVTDFSLRKEGLQIWLSESSGVLLDNPSNVCRLDWSFR